MAANEGHFVVGNFCCCRTFWLQQLQLSAMKSRFFDIVGQEQIHFEIEMQLKIETLYLVKFAFGSQTFKGKTEISLYIIAYLGSKTSNNMHHLLQ